MRIGLLKIALFALVIAAPVAALSFGVVKPYGQTSEHPKFPALKKLATGQGKVFDSLGEAILHRSAVTVEVIRLRSAIGYQRTHFVDIASIVSGRDDWLFYKGDFRACYDEADTSAALAQLDVLTDLAKSSGLDMTVSISPDKSVIYPEYLHPLAKYYWACKAVARRTLDDRIKIDAPRVVDHAQVLLAERAQHPDRKLYYETDTHWTPYGAALAFRQLMAALNPSKPYAALPPPHPTGGLLKHVTDMTVTLMVPREETADELDRETEARVAAIDAGSSHLKTVVLRDSFYEYLLGELEGALHYKVFHLELDQDKYPAEIATADRLIVNSIERFFIRRILKDELSWDALLAKAILTRNMSAAEKCTDYAAVTATPAKNGPLQLTVGLRRNDASEICLRLTLDSDAAGQVLVSLPMKQGEGSAFEPGRLVPMPIAGGQQTIGLILPGYLCGKDLRIDLGAKAKIKLQEIEIGQIGGAL